VDPFTVLLVLVLVAAAAGGGALSLSSLVEPALIDGEPVGAARLSEFWEEPAFTDYLPIEGIGGGGALDPNEVEALARVLASEASSGSDMERAAIGHCVRNRVVSDGRRSIYHMMFERPGRWKAQAGSNPPFSAAHVPSDADREFARQVLVDLQGNPVGNATSFFEPGQQDLCARFGQQYRDGGGSESDATPQGSAPHRWRFRRYHADARTIRERWTAPKGTYPHGRDKPGGYGLTFVATVGRFEFYR
jgi:hypothetical protein